MWVLWYQWKGIQCSWERLWALGGLFVVLFVFVFFFLNILIHLHNSFCFIRAWAVPSFSYGFVSSVEQQSGGSASVEKVAIRNHAPFLVSRQTTLPSGGTIWSGSVNTGTPKVNTGTLTRKKLGNYFNVFSFSLSTGCAQSAVLPLWNDFLYNYWIAAPINFLVSVLCRWFALMLLRNPEIRNSMSRKNMLAPISCQVEMLLFPVAGWKGSPQAPSSSHTHTL